MYSAGQFYFVSGTLWTMNYELLVQTFVALFKQAFKLWHLGLYISVRQGGSREKYLGAGQYKKLTTSF